MNQEKRTSRIIISLCLLGVFLLLFTGRLVQLQLVHGAEYAEQSKSISSASTRVKAARGEILDRNGNPLVINRQGNSIVFTAKQFPSDNEEEIAQRNEIVLSLIELLESKGEEWIDNIPLTFDANGNIAFPEDRESDVAYLKSDQILHLNSYATAQNCLDALIEKYSLQSYTPEQARKISSVYYEMHRLMFSERTPYTFAEDVSTETVAEIKEKSDFYQGVEIEVVPYREYVDGTLAPHILGMVGAISETEYEQNKDKGYLQTDTIGKNGIERAMESYLRGTDGTKRITEDDDGNVTTEYVQEPVQGNTIVLTIDKNLQKVGADSLAKRIADLKSLHPDISYFGGALVVIDVHTGEVLASVSYPTYDISTYNKDYAELAEAENAPLWNRAMMSTYAPGSTMKPGIAVTGLEEGVFNANTTYFCGGPGGYQRYRELGLGCSTGYHRNISVVHAIEVSCNNFFFEAGYQIGIDTMNEYSREFGLGQPTGIEISEETGILATPEYAESIGTPWRPGDTVQYAIGQSYNVFTPLQIANYAATLANGGTRYEAHLVKSIKSYDYSETILEKEPVIAANLEISQSTLDLVHEGMRRVGDTGFCANAFSKIQNGIKAAAKTGTAQVWRTINGESKRTNNGILITYAPAEDPEIAIGLVIEGSTTGVDCAPVAADIYNQYFSGTESSMDLPQENNTLLQ